MLPNMSVTSGMHIVIVSIILVIGKKIFISNISYIVGNMNLFGIVLDIKPKVNNLSLALLSVVEGN